MQQITKESNLAKFLRWGVYLTAFIPLIIWKDFISPFHFGKVMIFRSLIEILGAGYLILILRNPAYRPRRDKIFWAFFFFTAAFTLTTITSVLKYPSFWGSLERMGGLWTFWHYFLFFIILTSVLTKPEHWRKLLNMAIFVGVLSAFYGFFQKTNIGFFLGSGGRERIFGTIGNAALFAGFELLAIFLSLTFYFHPQTPPKRRKWYLLAFGIMSIAVLMTAVRGSLLGFAVGLLVFAWLWMRYGASKKWGKWAFTALIGMAVFWGIFSWMFSDASFVKSSRYLRRVTNLSLTATTVKTRAWAWQAGLKGWSESPKTVILGWGPENFNIPFSKYFNPKFFAGSGSETLFDRAHNMFIEILVTMGLIGFLAYLNVFVALLSSLRKALKNSSLNFYAIGLIPLLISYIIHNSFIFDTNPNFIAFFTIMGFVSFLGRPRVDGIVDNVRTREFQQKGKIGIGTLNLLTAFFIIFIPILIYKTNIVPAKANYATTRAIVRGWDNDFDGSFEKYQEALSYNVPGKYEYRHRLAQYLVGPGGPSVKEAKVREAYFFTLEEIDKNIKENSIDYLPYLYGSRLSIMLGRDDPNSIYNDKALDYSMKALELSPTFIRTYYEIAQAHLNKNNFEKAVEFFQKAVDLNPDTGLSFWYLGAAQIQSGDPDTVEKGVENLEKSLVVENVYRPSESDYLRLVGVYLENKDFIRVAETYEKLIIENSVNPQYYASLATAYANLDRINDAIVAARKAVEIDPSFESDARIFLKALGYSGAEIDALLSQ